MRAILCAALVCAIAGCSSTSPMRSAQLEPPILEQIPHETTAQGEAVVVVRDYTEPMKVDGRDDDRRVQYVWNYSRGVTQRRVWSADGLSFEATDEPDMTLNATPPEMDYAFSIIRADPYYSGVLTPETQLWGGFSVREADSPCDARTRCIQIFGVQNQGEKPVLHAVLALATGKIISYDYDLHLGLGAGVEKSSGGK